MAANDNALLVEDEPSWSDIYERMARGAGLTNITVTDNFEDAERAIDAMRFAVALVDIGLRVDDDRNIDGLRVMEKIRAAGDRTSIIVITGRSGRDVVPIIRDSIKKYSAYDTLAKSSLVPADLRRLVTGGLREYELGASSDKEPLYAALRGEMSQLRWDDEVMRKVGTSGGADGLYRAIQAMFGSFAPLVPAAPDGLRISDGLASGVFWSRGAGHAIAACLGQASEIDAVREEAAQTGRLLGRSVGKLITEYDAKPAKGVIYQVTDQERSDFGKTAS